MPAYYFFRDIYSAQFVHKTEIKNHRNRSIGRRFSIPSTRGIFDTKSERGNILFIFFGFTHCPHIRPFTLGRSDKNPFHLDLDQLKVNQSIRL